MLVVAASGVKSWGARGGGVGLEAAGVASEVQSSSPTGSRIMA